LTQGPGVERFEAEVQAFCGAGYAVAVSSGTAALHLAYVALGLGPGDCLWTSPNTFVATANAARYCGAVVDFVDIDPNTYNMSTEALRRKLELAQRSGKLPKIVTPVHFGGQPCDMPAIHDLAQRYGFRVVEDAAHAIGAEGAGGRVGNCRFSDITVLSFHPVKIVTTGEGGMLLCRDPQVAATLRRLRSHGTTRDTSEMADRSEGAWYYEQHELGYHYRLTDIQAALGSSQLRRIGRFLDRRRELVERYHGALKPLALTAPYEAPGMRSSWHLYVIQLGGERPERRNVFDRMRLDRILVNVHYSPVHLQPYYRALGFSPGHCPNAERYYTRALTLPLFPDLTEEQQDRVVASLSSALQATGVGR
jgi:UDP-4-amino-4,6-dideoxy-N-acetyl-beta-L-altrosamine transaminase